MRIEDEIKQKQFTSEFQKLWINILYTGNWMNSKSIKAFKPFGISPQQYNVLRILKGQQSKAISVNDIMSRMLDKNSNASRLVDKLKQKGLVKREVCENDRRQMDIAITEKGLRLIEEIEKNASGFEKIETLINEEEARMVNEILDKLRG